MAENRFIGKYFNGKSSQPQFVELIFCGYNDELKIQNENLKTTWIMRNIQYENYGNFIKIQRMENFDEFITIDNKNFKELFFNYLNKNDKLPFYQRVLNLGLGNHVMIAIVILAVITAGYIFAVPIVAERAVVLIPESVDKKLGDTFMNGFLEKNEKDTAKTLLLNEFAEKIDFNSRQKLNFSVVKSEQVNAFALPNGEIVVFTGILEKMDNYTELAALLGHEAVHVNNRHSMKMLCKNLAGYLFISALFSDVNGIIAIVAENAHSLNTLAYSRTFEKEADEQSVYLMLQNNINPQGTVSLFQMLNNEAEALDSKLLEYLQTHPTTSKRIANLQKIVSQNQNSSFTYDNPKLKSLFEDMKK